MRAQNQGNGVHGALMAAVLLSAALAIAAALQAELRWLHYVCKPLTTLLIFAIAWRAPAPQALYRRAVLVGLLELVGGLAVLVGFYARAAAIALAVFTIAASLVAHTNFADMSQMPANNLASDGVHPNDQGYVYMANVWYDAIKDLLPQ